MFLYMGIGVIVGGFIGCALTFKYGKIGKSYLESELRQQISDYRASLLS